MDFRYGLKVEYMTKKLVFKSRNKKVTLVLIVISGSHMFFSCIHIFPDLRKLFEQQAVRVPASVNAMKHICVIVILVHFTSFHLKQTENVA